MSPVSTAARGQEGGVRPAPAPPYPSIDLLRDVAKEIVVDWQMPPDQDRKS